MLLLAHLMEDLLNPVSDKPPRHMMMLYQLEICFISINSEVICNINFIVKSSI